MSQTHIIGAGVAGLTAAVSLVRKGCAVTLYEGSSLAGGRCRSYVDTTLERKIDNGNHLLLSGNKTALRYLVDIGSADKLIGPDSAAFPFFEIGTGRRWCLQPSAGILPWWILDARRRVPDTGAWDYFSALRLAAADVDRTVVDCVGDESLLFRRLWEPLAVAASNTPAQTGPARLLWLVLRDTFAKGETACRPRFARSGLSDAFVDPALKFLRRRGATIRFQHRLRRITYVGGKASRLDFNANKVDLPNHDSVVLALPPAAVARIVPSLKVPEESHTIVNAHFRLSEPAGLLAELPMIGLIGGTAQWLFVRGDVASITVSAADALAAEPADVIAAENLARCCRGARFR